MPNTNFCKDCHFFNEKRIPLGQGYTTYGGSFCYHPNMIVTNYIYGGYEPSPAQKARNNKPVCPMFKVSE